jgi:disulfide bond formation protein DsbB
VKHDITVLLAVLGVAAQALVVVLAVLFVLAAAGVSRPWAWVRRTLWGYELWAAFLVSAIATGGSLFFSEVAGYIPCELCWYQRICMYPLAITTLLAAIRDDPRVARYLLPLPVVGAAVSVYHLLVENRVIEEAQSCQLSAPGGCATKWIDEFGYLTIPTLALSAFVLVSIFLALAAWEPRDAGEAAAA